MALQHLLTETCADLADGLVGFGLCIVTRQEEGTVYIGALPFPVIAPDNDKIQGITDPGEVVLFHLFIGVNGDHPAIVRHTFSQFTLLLLGS